MKKDFLIYIACIFILFMMLFLGIIVLEITDKQALGQRFTVKDGIVLYELCNKKSGSQTNFILKSYGDTETHFRDYLLK